MRPRLLTTKHGGEIPRSGWGARVSRFLARRNRLVAVSEEVERIIHGWCKTTRFPVTVVPNGILAEAFSQPAHRQRVRARLGYGPEHCVLGIVARLAAEKDHHTLLRAFKELYAARPEARLAVIGDGPLRSPLEREAAELGIAECVSFLGERHDVPELLSGLDVFVLSSRTEGLPMTVLEAMAAGLPIVATRVGGVPAAVEDGVTGRLVEPASPPALAAALRQIIRHPEARRDMGRAGRGKLDREFSVSQTAARYEEIYHSL